MVLKSADVLITGASGFVGSAVARSLVANGYSVRAMVRHSSPRHHIADLGLDFCESDLRDAASVRRAVEGVRYLIHVAADYRLWVRDADEMFTTNVRGTRCIMQEALRAGIERVVHTSSVATLAVRADRTPADESSPLPECDGIGPYKRSKIAAERLIETMVAQQGLPAVIVNPSTPVGPRDVRPTPTGRIIVETANGRMPAFVDTGLNLVHVDDVAEGHLAALRHGRIGARYILGGTDVPLERMLADIAELVGRRAPRIRLPHWAVLPVAWAAEAAARVNGREPFATVDGVRMSRHWMFFSSGKAQCELGYRARPYRQGLADAIRWFRECGYVGPLTSVRKPSDPP